VRRWPIWGRGARLGVGSASAALRRALPLNLVIPARSKCWGYNYYGQLGLGDRNDRGARPSQMGANLPSVDLGSGWTAVEVAAGGYHTCVRLQNGAEQALTCWGRNKHGQLGLGDTTTRGRMGGQMGDSLPAVQLWAGRWAVALALGDEHSCALLDDASVKCWGWNRYGQLGIGDTRDQGDEGGQMGDSLPSVPLCLGPCPAGYTAASDGLACAACKAGTYTAMVGSDSVWRRICATCPAHSSSAAGSQLTDCACDAGYTGPDGWGPCVVCFDCDAVVTFTATVAISRAEFSADKQDAYVAGVAQALSVAPARVAIASITDQSSRRRLLAASVAVSTEVTVALAALYAVFSASSHTLCAMQSMPCLAASPLLWIMVWG